MSSNTTRVTLSIDGEEYRRPLAGFSGTASLFEIGQTWIEFHWPTQPEYPYENGRVFAGKRIELAVKQGTDRDRETTFTGRVVRLVGRESGLSILVAGPLQRLESARSSRGFSDTTDLDALRATVGNTDVEFTIQEESAASPRPFVRRQDETDREFAARLAKRNGWVIFEKGNAIRIAGRASGEVIQLTRQDLPEGPGALDFGSDLLSTRASSRLFHPNETARVSVNDVPGQGDMTEMIRQSSRAVFGDASHVVHHDAPVLPGALRAEIDARAKSLGAGLARFHVTTTHAGVQVGTILRHPDPQFLGEDVIVVAVSFGYQAGGRYVAKVTAVPLQLFASATPPVVLRAPGLALGEVVEDCDKLRLGRVRVRRYDDPNAACWARVGVGAAGPEHGTHWTPRVGTQVVLGFLDGSPDHPFVVDCLYHADARPDFVTENGTEEVLVVRTRGGSVIRVVEHQAGETIRIHQGDDNEIELQTGKEKPTIRVTTTGRLTLGADEVEVTARTIAMKATETIDLSCATLSTSSSDTTTIRSDGTTKLDADRLETTANSATFETSEFEVKGETATIDVSTAQVKASGETTIEGKPLRLN